MSSLKIDLNADVGEGYGPYSIGNDAALFPIITSANIACGFHAGDPSTIRRTLDLALMHGVSVGAHPGYPDRIHFGRLPLPYTPHEIADMILYQIGALKTMAESVGLPLRHMKLHGALYHQAAEDRKLAEVILDAIVRLAEPLIIVGPPESVLQQESDDRGLDYVAEGFADRGYGDQGRIISRAEEQSLISEPAAAARQALQIVKENRVDTVSGKKITLKVDTICIHSDTPGSAKIARAIRKKLEDANVAIEPLQHLIEGKA